MVVVVWVVPVVALVVVVVLVWQVAVYIASINKHNHNTRIKGKRSSRGNIGGSCCRDVAVRAIVGGSGTIRGIVMTRANNRIDQA